MPRFSALRKLVKQLPGLGNVIVEHDRSQAALEAASTELAKLQYDCSHFPLLEPKYSARNKLEFFDGIKNSNFSTLEKIQSDLISISKGKEFFVKQFCLCCNKTTSMLVDYQYSFMENQNLVPNWRERLACPECQMNNRQRLVAKLVQQHI